MSIDKFRFVSPGVYVNEIDNSQLPRLPEQMGPVIIGTSQRGPMMRPVKVQSFSDFIEVFGEPHPGNAGGDVWREGNKSAPTYGAYAAQAYLKNSGPVTFVRLGGYESPDAQIGEGKAGWEVSGAYGLYMAEVTSGSSGYDISGDIVLNSIIYSNVDVEVGGEKKLNGDFGDFELNTFFVSTNGTEIVFRFNNDNDTIQRVNLNKKSKKFIRSVLNTNPTTNNYFLGETFYEVDVIEDKYAFALVLLDATFENHKKPASEAQSGWVFSQHKAQDSTYPSGSSGNHNTLQKLFKVHGLTEGSWVSQNLKVSIEDIKEPVNDYVKYGSFTLSLRRIDDNDLAPQYVERFVGLNLDPTSDNYIAKKIGDKYTEWNPEKKEFIEYGNYDNKSKFIRVAMHGDVDDARIDHDLLPFGFYAPTYISDVEVNGLTEFSASYFSGSITTPSAVTSVIKLPKVPFVANNFDTPAKNSYKSVYYGLKSNINETKNFNINIVDYTRDLAYGTPGTDSSDYFFSLDDIKLCDSTGAPYTSPTQGPKYYTWQLGCKGQGSSLTAKDSGSLLLQNFNRFTMPLFGGTDGFDITVANPFSKGELSGKTQDNSYAYNSVKVAIESVADPEVVECNAMAIPGICEEGLTGLLIDKCEVRGDALAVIDLDGDYVPETKAKPIVSTVIDNLKNRAINSSYGCAYFPWVLVKDTINNNTVWMPPSVAALGTFSSTQKKTDLWFAPAGFNRGGLTDGAAGLPVVQTSLRLSSKDRDDLYLANINPIATFPSEGIVILGQKTLQVTPSALDRINVRRLMIYLKKEISRMARTVLFDPNIQVTWKRFTNQAVPFLDSVKSRFGLSDFKVVLDETTTTPELVDRNVVYAKILLKPTRAIEFIALDFVILPTGAAFTD